jgi:anti-sigma factor RsiW
MCPGKILLSAYYDNEVDVKKARDIALHIENCPKCRRQLQLIKELTRHMRKEICPEPDKAAAYRQICHGIRRRKTVGSSALSFKTRLTPYARAAAFTLFLLFVGSNSWFFLSSDKGMQYGRKGDAGRTLYFSGEELAMNDVSVSIPEEIYKQYDKAVFMDTIGYTVGD